MAAPGEAWCQRVDLCVRLREILRAYNEAAIALEMAQNADDAGARQLHLCIDRRHFGALAPGGTMAGYLGPCYAATMPHSATEIAGSPGKRKMQV
jgi:hypothetical protein